MGFEEKRGYIRRYFGSDERYFIEYKTHGKFFQRPQAALSLNLSASGLLFRAAKIIPVNTVLDVNLSLPHIKKPIPMLARVVRMEPTQREGMFDIAIFYTEISDSNRTLIDQFCTAKKDDLNPPLEKDEKK